MTKKVVGVAIVAILGIGGYVGYQNFVEAQGAKSSADTKQIEQKEEKKVGEVKKFEAAEEKEEVVAKGNTNEMEDPEKDPAGTTKVVSGDGAKDAVTSETNTSANKKEYDKETTASEETEEVEVVESEATTYRSEDQDELTDSQKKALIAEESKKVTLGNFNIFEATKEDLNLGITGDELLAKYGEPRSVLDMPEGTIYDYYDAMYTVVSGDSTISKVSISDDKITGMLTNFNQIEEEYNKKNNDVYAANAAERLSDGDGHHLEVYTTNLIVTYTSDSANGTPISYIKVEWMGY